MKSDVGASPLSTPVAAGMDMRSALFYDLRETHQSTARSGDPRVRAIPIAENPLFARAEQRND